MPWILMKNNLKLMLRSKWILFLMIVMPLITIALLSNAFRSMLNTSYEMDDFKVGFRVSEDSKFEPMIANLQDACKKQNIILQKYPEGNIKELLQNETVAVFVEIKDDKSYTLYQSNEKKKEAAITDCVFSAFFYQVNEAVTIQNYAMQNAVTPPSSGQTGKVTHEVLPSDPIASSTDYYGIVYIVYFAWCGMISLVAVISSERKSAIPKRIRVTQISKFQHYLGKFIPCTLAIFIEVCSAWILSILLFDVHWGNIALAVLIITLISLATSALGIILFQLFYNVAISIVIAFILTWVAGFFGGAFEPYMYLTIPDYLIKASPIYYVNRTLVEFSVMGHSNYTGICIVYLGAFILIGMFVGILLMNRKMEEQ